MLRIFGLLMCSSLATVGLWLAGQTSAQDPEPSENPFEKYRQPTQGTASSAGTQQATAEGNPFAQTAGSVASATGTSSNRTSLSKRRVDDLLRQARTAYQKGDQQEALRLATVAQRTAVEWKVAFAAGEQTPEKMIAFIQTGGASTQEIAQVASTPVPENGADRLVYVQKLLQSAREDMQASRFDEAARKIDAAEQIDVVYGALDLRPEHVRNELSRVVPASPEGPSPAFAAAPMPMPQAPAAFQPSFSSENLSPEEKKARAAQLVQAAQQACSQGHYNEARQMATEAAQYDVVWTLLETQPHHVLAEIERLTQTSIIASRTAAPQPASDDRRGAALQLLADARALMSAGRAEEALAKAQEAQQLDVAYGVVDDTPELVLQDLKASHPEVMSTSLASKANEREQALTLLVQAREAIRSGELDLAEAKVRQVEQMDVTFELFDDQPEKVREILNQLVSEYRAQGRELPRFAQAEVMAAGGTTPESFGPAQEPSISFAGMSALDAYNAGVSYLREGNRSAAYQAFLYVHESGGQLDPYRQQQLQDKLRELAPRRNPIGLASNQTVSSGNLLPSTPGRLNAALSEQAIKYEKVRSETVDAVIRADRMRDQNPDGALKLLDETQASIEASGLGTEQTSSLLASVNSTRSSVEAYVRQRAPLFEQDRKNKETRSRIAVEIETKVRVEQELAVLVEEYNELMEQKRFPEAHAKALQAKELAPENPVVVQLELQSQFAMRVARNEDLKGAKEKSFWETLDGVEWSAVNPVPYEPIAYPENWKELRDRRKPSPVDGREHTAAEMRVKQSLKNPISLHFENAPLSEVMQHIADTQGINVVVDESGLSEEAVTPSTLVSINIDGIRLQSALNLLLHPMNLDYVIENEVLTITSRLRQQGDLKTVVYQVADLIVPITVRNSSSTRAVPGPGGVGTPVSFPGNNGLNSIPSGAAPQFGNGFAQVGNNPFAAVNGQQNPMASPVTGDTLTGPMATNYDFSMLSDLVTRTVEPSSWDEVGGQGTVHQHDSTLSLVIRQTQRVHQEIQDLLDQLRRLQDLQVTIEVRFLTVSDNFFEQIGVDFDFNVNDTVGGPAVNNNFDPLRPFGAVDPVNGGLGGAGGTTGQAGQAGGGGQGQGGQQGQQGQQGGTAQALQPFAAQPRLNIIGRDNWPARTVVGLLNGTTAFSPELDIPFRQGSFQFATPPFGGDQATIGNAGLDFGLAILSDIEAFLFVRAVQGDRRTNVMFAPKITLFNGSIGTVQNQTQRPFVTSLTPVASAFAIGFQPQITTIPEGTSLTVRAVVSADRRYVRLTVLPVFSSISDVFTFSFVSGGGITGGGGGGGGFGGGGGGFGGGGGGFGGGGGGGFGGGGFGGGGQGGGGGQQGQQGNTGGGAVTVQQPVVNFVTVDTVVSVPDGGTVLLGGVKSLREGRTMSGVPILNKIPYISRLFKNTGIGRETQSLMLMVTPRIIIQEEEEELLGIPN